MDLAPEIDRRADRAAGRRRATLAPLVALGLLVVLTVLGTALGPDGVNIPVREVGAVVARHVPLGGLLHLPVPSDEADAIIWDLRLPRTFAAILIGALLALAGVALQGLLMNPLADPYTVGVSAGAALGAAFAEALGLAGIAFGLGRVSIAFAGAIGAVALVYSLARVGGRVSVQTFLLAGVVVGTVLWSLIPLVMVLSGRAEDLQRVFFFLVGSLQSADWVRALLLAPFALLGAALLAAWSRELNLMSLGEESALHLGVAIESFKVRVLLVGSLVTAAAVSVGGIIGFVGLIVPHLARRIVGPDHRALLPLAAVLGSLLLLTADTLVRVWLADRIPVGVITSVVGGPVFCYLLRRRRAVAW